VRDHGSASRVEFRGGTRIKYAESNSVQLPVIRASGHYGPEGVVCRNFAAEQFTSTMVLGSPETFRKGGGRPSPPTQPHTNPGLPVAFITRCVGMPTGE